ncbi:hypothetical protein OAH12_01015 [Cyclobacteriaceae bacterium]|nr:hypothetical protein [Cyclobacteriaceae bacterium]
MRHLIFSILLFAVVDTAFTQDTPPTWDNQLFFSNKVVGGQKE